MKRYDSEKSSVQYQSTPASGPSLLTGYRQEDGLTAVWSAFEASSYLPDDNNTEDNSYHYSEGQILASSSDLGSWFGVDHVDSHSSRRRRQLYERLWRIDQGLDIDPGNRSLGIEAGHYADPNVELESITSADILNYRMADACAQQMELPPLVRNKVLYLASNRDHRRFNRLGGLEGAMVGYCIKGLAEFQGCSSVMELKDSAWWPVIQEFAEDIRITGATGRQFRQLTEYVDDRCKGGA